MPKRKVSTEQCPNCETQQAVSLFKHHDEVGAKVCIFCFQNLSDQIAERRKQDALHKSARVIEQVEIQAQDRMRERRDNDLRIKQEQAVKEARAAKKAARQEISPDETDTILRKELAQRALCRRHLLPFVQRFNDKYDPGWVHKDICQRLEQFSLDVAQQKSPRLMLFMPPRHGKSELASRSFPSWHLGKYPEHEFIACSYASDLALGFSRKVRELVRAPEYRHLFPDLDLSRDSQRADSWRTTADGGYAAAGVGGPITGKGAHILLIDDPVKNREEADSEATRRSIKDWYTSTAYTRLAPGGGVLIILTRWHDDDLAGWLLSQAAKGEGDKWEVVEYPAIATKDERYRRKGEALHPSRYPLDALQRIKRAVGDRDWSALYQQQPVADEGEFFTRDMIRWYGGTDQPGYDEMNYYTAWDLAIGKAEENDETFGITVGIDRQRRLWVVDVRHGRWGSQQIVDQILSTYEVWRSDVTGIERGHIELAIGPYLEQEIQRRGLSTMYIEPLKPGRRDKQSRARPIQALMSRGQVLFRRGCEATQYLTNQMLRFPSGVHDDGVDAIAWIGQLIQGMTPVAEVKPKTVKGWREKLHRMGRAQRRLGGSHMQA